MSRTGFSVFFLLLFSVVAFSVEAQNKDLVLRVTISPQHGVAYPFDIPTRPEKCCRLNWTLNAKSSSYSGRQAYLQFSYDNITWWNLPSNATVNATTGIARGSQIVDASWARAGMNYLRVCVAGNFSEIKLFSASTNTRFWLVDYQLYLFLSAVVLITVVLIWEKKKRKLRFSDIDKKDAFLTRHTHAFLTYLQETPTSLKPLLKPKIAVPLIIGALIRLSLAPLTEHRWDMYIWRLNQAFVYHYQVNPFWPEPAPLEFAWGYPPLWLLTLLLVYPIYSLAFSPPLPANVSELWHTWIETGNMCEAYHSFVPNALPILSLINKAPIIIADLLIALALYKLIKPTSKKYAYYAFFAWLFNPYVIWISSVWGMFDAIPTLFVLLSLHFLLVKKYVHSTFLLVISALFKLYSIILIPLMFLIIYKRREKIQAVKYVLISICLILLTTFATYAIAASLSGQNPLTLSTQLTFNVFYKRSSPDWKGENMFVNLTPLVVLNELFTKLDVTKNIPVSPLLMSTALLCIMISVFKNKTLSKQDIIAYVVVTHFTVYLTYSVVNEQFFIWVLPLLLFLAAEKKSNSLKYFYWAMSIFNVFYITYRYDLSYFISPYFLPDTLGLWNRPLPPPDPLVLAWIVGILYIIGIKLALWKPNLGKRSVKKV